MTSFAAVPVRDNSIAIGSVCDLEQIAALLAAQIAGKQALQRC